MLSAAEQLKIPVLVLKYRDELNDSSSCKRTSNICTIMFTPADLSFLCEIDCMGCTVRRFLNAIIIMTSSISNTT